MRGQVSLFWRCGESGELLLRGGALVQGLPLGICHAVNDFAGIWIGDGNALIGGGLAIPAAEAIAAETGEIHQIDILGVGAFAQVLHQAAKGGGFELFGGGGIERGGRHSNFFLGGWPCRFRGHSLRMVGAVTAQAGWAMDEARCRAILTELFTAAVASADPARVLAGFLPPEKPRGRCVVVGAGKAAASMAAAVDAAWGDVDLSGVVVTRYGHEMPAGRIEVISARHPVPDENSVKAARRILASVAGLGADDLVIVLISGGGSALMALPAAGISLAEKQGITAGLLASGAAIDEINRVRKRLSGVKGGRLLAACGAARVVTLAISDVPGDAPSLIASGPTVFDDTSADTVLEILGRYRIEVSATVRAAILANEPPALVGDRGEFKLIATPSMALAAAAARARELGISPVILGDAIEGEAWEAGRAMAIQALQIDRPSVLLAGGETSVTLGDGAFGRGGRNCEFLLSSLVSLQGAAGIYGIACDTDGIDGSEDAAGALITPGSLKRACAVGVDAAEYLARHDSYGFFSAVGDLVITGPTLTNVNDFRAFLVVE